MVRDVFVSYSQPDYGCAMELVGRVEEEGINCWIAPRDIAPSADWAAEIIDAISKSRTMILVFSASSNESPQVRREVERAVHKQVSILPFRIENVLPSKSLEYFLSAQHWMDAFPPPREPHYARLCAYLKVQRGQEAPDAATTQPAPVLASAPAAAPLDPAEVLRIERLLAGYIGPIAKLLVKSAALRAATAEQLVSTVAAELETETDRHEFMRRWRTSTPRDR
ncbi:MAG TPA: toll/interleukin-1 receptor domain-containing protein [Steroidobacteraceae bacterium]|nr:toll/interleukin-1 receptor domain-containing protein [Steroidobacteraceae bacterium]